MSDYECLKAALMREPDDKAHHAAMVDWLAEFKGMSARGARVQVAADVCAARAARRVADAEAYLSVGSPYRMRLHYCIRWHLSIPRRAILKIEVRDNDYLSAVINRRPIVSSGARPRVTVFVGAHRVLKWVASFKRLTAEVSGGSSAGASGGSSAPPSRP